MKNAEKKTNYTRRAHSNFVGKIVFFVSFLYQWSDLICWLFINFVLFRSIVTRPKWIVGGKTVLGASGCNKYRWISESIVRSIGKCKLQFSCAYSIRFTVEESSHQQRCVHHRTVSQTMAIIPRSYSRIYQKQCEY